jgi:hypothetical protein
VDRHGHRPRGRRVGNQLPPFDLIPHIDQAFVHRAEMLVYGDYHLFGQRRKLNRRAFGSMFPGRKAQTSLKCTNRHYLALLFKRFPQKNRRQTEKIDNNRINLAENNGIVK